MILPKLNDALAHFCNMSERFSCYLLKEGNKFSVLGPHSLLKPIGTSAGDVTPDARAAAAARAAADRRSTIKDSKHYQVNARRSVSTQFFSNRP